MFNYGNAIFRAGPFVADGSSLTIDSGRVFPDAIQTLKIQITDLRVNGAVGRGPVGVIMSDRTLAGAQSYRTAAVVLPDTFGVNAVNDSIANTFSTVAVQSGAGSLTISGQVTIDLADVQTGPGISYMYSSLMRVTDGAIIQDQSCYGNIIMNGFYFDRVQLVSQNGVFSTGEVSFFASRPAASGLM